jgi:rod shape-determining protein MreD
MLALDFADRRTIWRDYWIEWALAALLILMEQAAHWQVAAWMGAPMPFWMVVPPLVISIVAFPMFAWAAARLDRWRLSHP